MTLCESRSSILCASAIALPRKAQLNCHTYSSDLTLVWTVDSPVLSPIAPNSKVLSRTDGRTDGCGRDHMIMDVRTCHPLSLSLLAHPPERSGLLESTARARAIAATEPKEGEGEPAARRSVGRAHASRARNDGAASGSGGPSPPSLSHIATLPSSAPSSDRLQSSESLAAGWMDVASYRRTISCEKCANFHNWMVPLPCE